VSNERWDVRLKILDGPLAHMPQQLMRGPVVRIGAAPGPGGLSLTGYRGLDKRHAVITAYEGGTATIAPVGTSQVRMAPHSNVSWQDIDPMSRPEYLSRGCAIHLGPVNRGCTLEFIECQRLGEFAAGNIVSEFAGAPPPKSGVAPVPGMMGPPAAVQAKRTRTVGASTVPAFFVGCLVMMAMVSVTVIGVAVFVKNRSIERLGPRIEDAEYYDFATLDDLAEHQELYEGLAGGFSAFVMGPNADAAGKKRLENMDTWDQNFYDYTQASVVRHMQDWKVFKRLDAIVDQYATVVQVMRDNELPDVFAAIPYQESRYRGGEVSIACAAGYWQFMPEVAWRVDRDSPGSFKVSDCKIKDVDAPWSPTSAASPPIKSRPYLTVNYAPDGSVSSMRCRINACRIDDRKDLDKSTAAAAYALKEAWTDRDIADSGAAVQITILSHNAGYDDKRFGQKRPTNLLPAYKSWRTGVAEDQWHTFYGTNIACKDPHEGTGLARCGSKLPAETQHYAYTIIAQHLIAACYYGLNYSDTKKEFAQYKPYTKGKGYCTTLQIPEKEQVRLGKTGGK